MWTIQICLKNGWIDQDDDERKHEHGDIGIGQKEKNNIPCVYEIDNENNDRSQCRHQCKTGANQADQSENNLWLHTGSPTKEKKIETH
jgi:hypothetical protein